MHLHRLTACTLYWRNILLMISLPILLSGGVKLWADSATTPKILVLHSYNQGYEWTDRVNQGVAEIFGVYAGLDYYVEYMDANRYSDSWYLQQLVALYGYKYANKGIHFDAVVTVDDNAFNFALEHRTSLFFDAPLVFCGVHDIAAALPAGNNNIYGIEEEKSIKETIDQALLLFPETTTIVALAGRRPVEQDLLASFRQLQQLYSDRYRLQVLDGLPATDLRQALAGLDVNSIIVYLSYMQDINGKQYSYQDGIQLAASNPAIPVFGLWDFHIREGILGGKVVHASAQGQAVAVLALEVAEGSHRDQEFLVRKSPNRFLFDDSSLHGFGLTNEALPIGSELINLQISHFTEHWQRGDIKSFFGYDLFENHGAVMLLIDPESGLIVDANRAARFFYGYPRLDEKSITDINTLTQEQTRQMMALVKQRQQNSFNFQHRLADGSLRNVDVYSWPVRVADTDLIFSIIHDVTARVTAERQSRKQQLLLGFIGLIFLALSILTISILLRMIRAKRFTEKRLRTELRMKSALLDAIPNPVFFKDGRGRYIGCNRAYETFYGRRQSDLVGKTLLEVNTPEQAAKYAQMDALLLENPTEIQTYEWQVQAADGHARDVLFHKAAMFAENQVVSGLVGVITDITERRVQEKQLQQSLQDKQTLIKELYHRTKNNMQVISSFISLQASGQDNPKLLTILRDIDQRIKTMALVHQMLYNTGDLSRIKLDLYAKQLFESTFESYHVDNNRILWEVVCDEIFLLLDLAIPCGLIINELLTNSCKYAFPDGRSGTIVLQIRRQPDGRINMEFKDDGVGLPADIDLHNAATLGMSMVKMLVEHQLEGSIVVSSGPGVRYSINFSDDKYSARVEA